MTDLDTRLRAAGDSLLRASERISPAAPPRSLRPLATLATVAVALVVLVVGGVFLRDDGGGDTVVAASVTPPRLIPDVVPAGLEPQGATELPEPDATPSDGLSITVYGDPDAADPLAIDLGVVLLARGDPLPGGEAVRVRGQTGTFEQDELLGTVLAWEESPELAIVLASHALDGDQLRAIAEELTVDAAARSVELGPLPNDVIGPLVRLGAMTNPLAGSQVPLMLPADVRGLAVSYQGDNGAPIPTGLDDRLDVALFSGDAEDLAVIRWAAGALTSTPVRGHQGWAGPADAAGEVAAVVWEESPGVLAVVQSFGLSPADVGAAAESLRPATADEWDALLNLGASHDFSPPGEEPKADPDPDDEADVPADAIDGVEGVYADGTWAVYLRADGAVCGVVDDGQEPTEACRPDQAPVTVAADSAGQPIVLFGVMPEAATGRLTSDGDVELSQTRETPNGRSIYAMVIVAGQAPSAITFVGPDGREVTTSPVDR